MSFEEDQEIEYSSTESSNDSINNSISPLINKFKLALTLPQDNDEEYEQSQLYNLYSDKSIQLFSPYSQNFPSSSQEVSLQNSSFSPTVSSFSPSVQSANRYLEPLSSPVPLNIYKETRPLDELYTNWTTIARGNFGEVSVVQRVQDNKVVALKNIEIPRGTDFIGALKLAQRELQILTIVSRLCKNEPSENENESNKNESGDNENQQEHCGVVPIYNSFYTGNFRNIYIEMKYIAGGNAKQFSFLLFQQLQKSTTFVREALQLFVDNFYFVVYTLNQLHSLSIIHRDIKPQNLLYDSARQRLLIADFGISCIKLECSQFSSGGTVSYIDPAVLLASGENDEYSDIYSVGLVFFEILHNAISNLHMNTVEKNSNNFEPVFDYQAFMKSRYFTVDYVENRWLNAQYFIETMPHEYFDLVPELDTVTQFILNMMRPLQVELRPNTETIIDQY